ncbi:HB2J protein, partial [Pomatorhinus ruficollis]|nr:HB2J protein [Pomatorhinus ruficollis]
PPDLCPAHSGVFQDMHESECYFIKGTEKVRFVDTYMYNRKRYIMFDSDVGYFVRFSPGGKKQARYANSVPEILEHYRGLVDCFCRPNYEGPIPFLAER